MVEGPGQSFGHSSIPPASSLQTFVYGRQFDGLGSPLRRPDSLGLVACSYARPAYQCFGDGGSLPSSKTLAVPLPASGCVASHGQLDRRGVHQQAGGGGTHSESLAYLTIDLLEWCHARDISLSARHIPGHMNVLADGLSRRGQVQPTEWSLSPHVFRLLIRLWGSPHVDLFATQWNAKLPTFVSPIPDPQAWSVDALSTSWDGLFAYAYPPAKVIDKVLLKLKSHDCQLILVAPCLPQRPWFPDLLRLLVDFPRPLPDRWDLLK